MSSPDRDGDSNAKPHQQAEFEKQIVQIEEATRQQKRFERRGCLGCVAIIAVPVIFFTWRLIDIGISFSEAGDFQKRVAAVGGRVRFSGGDDMGRALGVKGVSTIVIKKEQFSDKDMAKLAPLLAEAEDFGGLYFCQTKLTDKGLRHFPAGLKLVTLDFRATGVTKAGINQLLLRLPHLQETTIILDEGAVRHNQWKPLDELK